MKSRNSIVLSPVVVAAVAVVVLGALAGCPGSEINSEDTARIAYLGIDRVVSKSLTLGFAGFNAASNANIPAQSADGDESGKLDVTGQVDQGASDNRTMTLSAALTAYSDGDLDDPKTEGTEEHIKITYDTDAPLSVGLQLRNVPNGTFDGSLTGTATMSGDLTGDITLDVTLSGPIEEAPDNAGQTIRTPGQTHVTGTATNAQDSSFDIDETI